MGSWKKVLGGSNSNMVFPQMNREVLITRGTSEECQSSRQITMRRQLFSIVTLFCMISLVGCAQNRVILHGKGSPDTTDIAFLRTEGNIYVFKVDGTRPKEWTQNCTGKSLNRFTISHFADDTCESVKNTMYSEYTYELAPGDHTFTIYWAATHITVDKITRVVDLRFSVEKGKVYRLKSDGGFGAILGSDVVFTVEEEGTKITTGTATTRVIFVDDTTTYGWQRQLEHR